MRTITIPLAILLASSLPAQGSDVELTKDAAARFIRTKGESHVDQDVHWHVSAKTFDSPKKSRRGIALYVSKGIGIVTGSRSSAVEEVRRRGGVACIRGRVTRVPAEEREPGDPVCVIAVTSISRRRH